MEATLTTMAAGDIVNPKMETDNMDKETFRVSHRLPKSNAKRVRLRTAYATGLGLAKVCPILTGVRVVLQGVLAYGFDLPTGVGLDEQESGDQLPIQHQLVQTLDPRP
eukprot:72805-Rhodomonas_salina.5